MKIDWKKIDLKKLLICLAIPLGVGALAALLTKSSMAYAAYEKPPLSPPGWLFPIVWTILYLLMGWASYQILQSTASGKEKREALCVYGVQLALNFLWPLVFFRWEKLLAAFLVLIALWVAIYLTIRAFGKIKESAGDFLLPYLLWVSFAGYLNLGIYLLNG